jgi:hypothetical protein
MFPQERKRQAAPSLLASYLRRVVVSIGAPGLRRERLKLAAERRTNRGPSVIPERQLYRCGHSSAARSERPRLSPSRPGAKAVGTCRPARDDRRYSPSLPL